MSKATYYHIAGGELVEGTALGCITVVLGADFDTLAAAYVRTGEREHALRVELHSAKQKNDALQERLNAADQKDDDLSFQLKDREGSRRDWFEEAQRLQAKLADRDALLRKWLDGKSNVSELVAECEAALSASAEPSAPVERDERAEFDAAYERGDFYLEEQRSELKYQDYRRHQAWAVWQVRAALDKSTEGASHA